MNIPFEPLEAGGYRDIYRLACTVTAFFETHQHWPETLVTHPGYLVELFRKIPRDWHDPLLKRLRFEVATEEDTLMVSDSHGLIMDYSTASTQGEAQAGCDWLFSRPIRVTL
jgi:hypothetical protein